MHCEENKVEQLTNDPSTHRSPAFSPDGSQIAFWSDKDGVPNIYVMDADGSDVRQLTREGRNLDPSWAPDGRRIVFISNRGAPLKWFVYTMDPDGGNVTSLGAIVGRFQFQSRPVFSPDGTKILFASTRDNFFGDVFSMNSDGTGLEKLTGPSLSGRYPVWSPDGKSIAFQGFNTRAGGVPVIYLMDLATRVPRKLTDFSAEPHAWAWFPK